MIAESNVGQGEASALFKLADSGIRTHGKGELTGGIFRLEFQDYLCSPVRTVLLHPFVPIRLSPSMLSQKSSLEPSHGVTKTL